MFDMKRKLYLWLKKHGYHDEAKWLHKTKVLNTYNGESLRTYVCSFISWTDTPQGHDFWNTIDERIKRLEYHGFKRSWK